MILESEAGVRPSLYYPLNVCVLMMMFSPKNTYIFTNSNTNTIIVQNTKSTMMENVQCAQQQTFSVLIQNKI